jgi:hypothetical protein
LIMSAGADPFYSTSADFSFPSYPTAGDTIFFFGSPGVNISNTYNYPTERLYVDWVGSCIDWRISDGTEKDIHVEWGGSIQWWNNVLGFVVRDAIPLPLTKEPVIKTTKGEQAGQIDLSDVSAGDWFMSFIFGGNGTVAGWSHVFGNDIVAIAEHGGTKRQQTVAISYATTNAPYQYGEQAGTIAYNVVGYVPLARYAP